MSAISIRRLTTAHGIVLRLHAAAQVRIQGDAADGTSLQRATILFNTTARVGVPFAP